MAIHFCERSKEVDEGTTSEIDFSITDTTLILFLFADITWTML